MTEAPLLVRVGGLQAQSMERRPLSKRVFDTTHRDPFKPKGRNFPELSGFDRNATAPGHRLPYGRAALPQQNQQVPGGDSALRLVISR